MTENLVGQAVNKLVEGWHGHLDLVYGYRQGATQIIRNQVQAPLKVQRPFYPEGKEVCHSVILHTAGGVVGGDSLSMNFQLEADAKTLITTAAAGKIYRSSGLEARQSIRIKLAANANLEWLPQETIVFAGAIYRQDLRIELELGASLLLWEITRFGRSARGERFVSGEWRSHVEVWQQGRPLWIDRQLLKGEEMLESEHGLGGHPVAASLAWVGEPATTEIVEKVRRLSQGERSLWQNTRLADDGDGVRTQPSVGVTRLTDGLLCRYRGSSTAEARRWFIAVWQLLRLEMRDRPVCLPRVWPS
ncbi:MULTISPECIES: urease accessory protein UreD [Kamptonema]|uniref:urease accessory protein UreD n=1 Tax=Kamptonema TaxID=1501433 RepID=UPI0001DAC368|nr:MULTISPECIES: urease accessory protein UreD [Kamptonema]CBN53687.1 Urease accessory protein ureD [Kamptonema sp. PCC 6506]